MNTIKLNFLRVLPTDFDFVVFRQAYQQVAEGERQTNVFRLPETDQPPPSYRSYKIRLQPLDGYDRYTCHQNTNNDLTRNLLWTIMLDKLKEVGGVVYDVHEGHFGKAIDFVLDTTKYGNKTVTLSPYHLRAQNAFGWLIDYRFRKNREVQFDREVQRLSLSLDKNYRSNKDYYSDKRRILTSFVSNTLSRIFPIGGFGNVFQLENEFSTLPAQNLSKKVYLFGNDNTDSSQFQGIRKWGPYQPGPTKPLFVFIFEDRYRAFANEVFLALAGKTNPGTFSGFEPMFGLPFTKDNVKGIALRDQSKPSLDAVIDQVLAQVEQNPEEKLLVVFIEQSKDVSLQPSASPYYYLKYRLTKQKIPLQVISHEKNSDPLTLKWSTSNLGLQMFAKLGGIPWLVQPRNEDCVIIGIGSAHQKAPDGTTAKYLAYSVLLDSSGLYRKLDILADERNRDAYLHNLEQNLSRILRDPAMSRYKKVALHLPFKIKGFEIRSIRHVLTDIRDLEFHVLKVNDESRFFGFSEHNTSVPYESTYIHLSREEYLVWFEGLSYGKENVHRRTGNPVHIQFLRDHGASDAGDLSYLQDVLNLSGANWRGFNAKQLPVSIFYAKIVADYTRAFESFDDFDDEIFQNNFPWFL